MSLTRVAQIGFELDSLTANVEITGHNLTSSSSSSTISSAQANTGTYSSEFNITSGNGTADEYEFNASGVGTAWCKLSFYFTGNPSANCSLLAMGASASSVPGAFINSSGQIGVSYYNGSTITYGSTLSTAVSLNAWHYIEMKVIATTANSQTVSLWVDGTLVVNAAAFTATFAANAMGYINWGAYMTETLHGLAQGSIAAFYVDDIIVDTSSRIGNAKLARYTPSGAGDANTWLTGSGGTAGATNNYTRVDEVTPNGATSYNLYRSPTTTPSDLYVVTGPSLGSSPTINCVSVGVWFAGASASSNSSFEVQAEQTSGGTIQRSSSITPNSTTYTANALAAPNTYPLIMYTDPTGATWITGTVSSMQIGMYGNSSSTNYAEISTVWAYVDYTPGTASTPSVASWAEPISQPTNHFRPKIEDV